MRKYRLSEQTRQYCYEEEHGKQSVTLRQIVALIDFADVKAGSEGGWVDEECALSQQGECWIYDVNNVVFAGARIRDDARLTGFCVVSHEATIGGQACIHAAQISHHAQISDNVTVTQSQCAVIVALPTRRVFSPLPGDCRARVNRRSRQSPADLSASHRQRLAHSPPGANLRRCLR